MKKVICIIGPTASGKTDLSIKLAKHFNTEIISGDSVQVYRSLDIGSAKVNKDEMCGIKHHLIDILDPQMEYSVSDFQREARLLIDDILERGMIPIISGGTGFYIKSALYDYDFSSPKRTNEFESLSNEELYSRLTELNDESIPDINNRKRLLRHLEVLSSDSSHTNNKDTPLYDFLIIGLTMDREKLYERINSRVDNMFECGLLDEVKNLYDKGIHSNSVLSIGYKELYEYFDGKISLDDAKELIKKNTRNFAKRQYTYFNNQLDVKWIDVLNEDALNKSINLINEFINR